MICGHKNVLNILKSIEEKSEGLDYWPVNFLIFTGVANIGKTFITKKFIDRFGLFQQDILMLEDPKWSDGKEHQIKIGGNIKELIVEVWNKKYLNYGAREIKDYALKTPAWDRKIIFIENIDRMNHNATNALLKIFEEPPKNLFIIGTSSGSKKLLDTIISRAMTINFTIPSFEGIKDCIKEKFPNKEDKELLLAYDFSWWRIWFMVKILKEWSEFLETFESFIQIKKEKYDFLRKRNIIDDIVRLNAITTFLDAMMFYSVSIQDYTSVNLIVDMKKKYYANVGIEHLLFNFLNKE